ncbi:hypothetical protein MSIBF_A3050003 [groundwater metagenome]|uniref:Dockerin domain-containing protein n=1 Tax=groundwater metagenome TaxID=717931 RepID=A0A098ED87_9ZZZZ
MDGKILEEQEQDMDVKMKCAECKEPKDIFDAVEMLEYLSGDKENSTPCWDLNNDHTINLLDVLALIDNIGTE